MIEKNVSAEPHKQSITLIALTIQCSTLCSCKLRVYVLSFEIFTYQLKLYSFTAISFLCALERVEAH